MPEANDFLTDSEAEERTLSQPPTTPEARRTGIRGFLEKPIGKVVAGSSILLAAGGLVVGITSGLSSANSSAEPNPSETPGSTSTPDAARGDDAYIVPLAQLATMTPEQITQLSTISVESVTVNGAIDWKLYAKKLNDIMNLGLNAGTTATEMNAAYNNEVDPGEYVSKYDTPFIAGFATPDTVLDGYEQIHASNAIAAYKGTLLGATTTWSVSNLIDTTVLNPSETGATLELTVNNRNNFFSSGAFNADSEKDVAQAGTNADLDTTTKGRFTVEVQGADIKLIRVDKIG
jgi:hypothetical protein